jgi:hypothetical protein
MDNIEREHKAELAELADAADQADARFYAMRDDRDRLQTLVRVIGGERDSAVEQLEGAVDALLAAPMPEVESTLKGEEWAERYDEWWHEYVRPHVVGGQ